ncbi:hypothetical protein, partial [Burkholderia multivorans]|uniref:hypothetical protein n=1 Tax=Burkholderia multivorans TaxID=87883 RepID=UPI0028702315
SSCERRAPAARAVRMTNWHQKRPFNDISNCYAAKYTARASTLVPKRGCLSSLVTVPLWPGFFFARAGAPTPVPRPRSGGGAPPFLISIQESFVPIRLFPQKSGEHNAGCPQRRRSVAHCLQEYIA